MFVSSKTIRSGNRPAVASPSKVRAAMTLIELLVVMAIISILVSTAIPVLSPASDARRIREATRSINTFIAGAQARALEKGRLVGVGFRKLSQETGREEDNGVCTELYYVEQPPAFSGFDDGSRVMVAPHVTSGRLVLNRVVLRFVRVGNDFPPNVDELPSGFDPEQFPPRYLRSGDTLSINGTTYRLSDTSRQFVDENGYYDPEIGSGENIHRASSLVAETVETHDLLVERRMMRSGAAIYDNQGQGRVGAPVFDNLGNTLSDVVASIGYAGITNAGTDSTPGGAPHWSSPLRYKINRQASSLSKSFSARYQLPAGTAIDLEGSAFSDGTLLHQPTATNTFDQNNNGEDVVVMFSPEGAMVTATVPDYSEVRNEAKNVRQVAVQSDLYLLVGLRENVISPNGETAGNTPDGLPVVYPQDDYDFGTITGTDAELQEKKALINWLNPDSRWLTINARSGSIIASENAFVDPQAIAQQIQGTWPETLAARRQLELTRAREFAILRQRAGGR